MQTSTKNIIINGIFGIIIAVCGTFFGAYFQSQKSIKEIKNSSEYKELEEENKNLSNQCDSLEKQYSNLLEQIPLQIRYNWYYRHPFPFVVFFSLGDLLFYAIIPVTIVFSKLSM